MPLCTPADVKGALGARIDADITDYDAELPALIESATLEIEQACNLPDGWFDQTPAPAGKAVARRACIALCSLSIGSPTDVDARRAILSSSLIDPIRNYGPLPTIA